MRYFKFVTALMFAILSSGCSLTKDYYKALDDTSCYYNHDNILLKSRNGTCLFLADTIYSTTYNNKSITIHFSALDPTGYMNIFRLTRQNAPGIVSLFNDFIAWSELDEKSMQIEEDRFNNSPRAKNEVSSRGVAENQYQYISKPPKTLGFKSYQNSPLLMIKKNITFFGIPQPEYWLVKPDDARRLIILIEELSTSLD
ncbi:hypothetical protein [Siccibacter turicensis]|uniref:hypothetical protein n=2 Tax=Siccibacter TaxID=1649298 RepID=UPI0010220C2B|nr:hypothetical protein [Siccibacter turicensis]